jgi:DDE superfamily endonuclease
MVEDRAWLGKLRGELCELLAPVFTRAGSRRAAFAYVDAVLAIDETAELKKGVMTVGVARQHAGIIRQIANCQTIVTAA